MAGSNFKGLNLRLKQPQRVELKELELLRSLKKGRSKEYKEIEDALFDTIVRLEYYYTLGNNKKCFVYYSDLKANPRDWDFEKQRYIKFDPYNTHIDLNDRLTLLESIFIKTVTNCKNEKRELKNDFLKEELDKEYKGVKIEHYQETFYNYIEQYLKANPKNLSAGTIRNYRNCLTTLKNFEKEEEYKIAFDTFTLNFYKKFIIYCREDQQLATNTIGKLIRYVKVFLSQAEEEDLVVCQDYKKKSFTSMSEEADSIFLNKEQILKIYNAKDLSPRLDRVRDLFIVGCATSLRFSDYTRIKKEHIKKTDKGEVLEISTQKTKDKAVIPLHWMVKEILEKYNGVLPRPISNTKMNKYLKELLEHDSIKLTDPIEILKPVDGVTKKVMSRICDEVHTHTARRSGASNMYLSGIPSISIMKITTHKTESAFLKYIKVSNLENAQNYTDHLFFTK